MNAELKRKPHKCAVPVCGKAFTDKGSIRYHMMKKHPEEFAIVEKEKQASREARIRAKRLGQKGGKGNSNLETSGQSSSDNSSPDVILPKLAKIS